MAELTIDQKKALALAAARKRAAEAKGELKPVETGPLGKAGNWLYDTANSLGLPASRIRRDLRGVDDAVRGAADTMTFGTADEISAGLDTVAGRADNYDQALAAQRQRDQTSGPMRTVGQIGGGLALGAGAVRAGLSPAARAVQQGRGLLPTMGVSGLEGGAYGAAYGFGSGEGAEDRSTKAGTGMGTGFLAGAATPAVVAGGNKLVQSLVSPHKISPARKAMIDALTGEGVPLTAGQKTGSQKLRYAESEIGGRKAAQIYEQQGEEFTRAALSRVGINASRATPDVIDDGFRAIGQQFDDLASRNTLQPDRQFADDIMDVVTNWRQNVPPSARAPIVEDLARDIVQASRGGMRGESYQRISSRLARMARSARSDPERSQALYGLREALDDAMGRSIASNNPADAGAWQQVRNQYRNMLVIERAATGAGENAALGIISPSQLRNATVNQHGRRNYARGSGDFAELSRAGEALMKPLPQSGTAPRMAAQLGKFGVQTGTGGIIGGMIGGPPGAALGGTIGAAMPMVKGAAMMSGPGQAYLTNQAFQGVSPQRRAILEALMRTTGIPQLAN